MPPRFASPLASLNEGSGAPTGARVLARHPSRASDVGPQARKRRALRPAQTACAVRAPGTLASRRSTAAVYWLRARLGRSNWALKLVHSAALLFAWAHSRVPLVVAGGRSCPEPPGGVVTSQPAGRRIPLRLWLVSGDALGEQDGRKIVIGGRMSKISAAMHRETVDMLLMPGALHRHRTHESDRQCTRAIHRHPTPPSGHEPAAKAARLT